MIIHKYSRQWLGIKQALKYRRKWRRHISTAPYSIIRTKWVKMPAMNWQDGPWVLSQYPKRRLSVRSRKVSKPRDLYLELSDRSEIWQALRQQCCRCACQISKRYDNLKYQSRGFETLRDLTKRRLFGYWDGALLQCITQWRWKVLRDSFFYILSFLWMFIDILHSLHTWRRQQNSHYFADVISKLISLHTNCCSFVQISLKHVHMGLIDSYISLVQIMAWRETDDPPLSELMKTCVFWRRYASHGLDEWKILTLFHDNAVKKFHPIKKVMVSIFCWNVYFHVIWSMKIKCGYLAQCCIQGWNGDMRICWNSFPANLNRLT